MPLITFLILAYFFPDTADRPGKDGLSHPDSDLHHHRTGNVRKIQNRGDRRGRKSTYRYFFFNKTGGVLTWKTENNSFEASAKSKPAAVTVVDNNGCTKKIELKESVK